MSQTNMDGISDTIVKEGCSSLLGEIFLDLEQHLNELVTKKWMLASNTVKIPCLTVEEYFNGFARIKKSYKKKRMANGVPVGHHAEGHFILEHGEVLRGWAGRLSNSRSCSSSWIVDLVKIQVDMVTLSLPLQKLLRSLTLLCSMWTSQL